MESKIKIERDANVLSELFGAIKFEKSTETILREVRKDFANVEFKKK